MLLTIGQLKEMIQNVPDNYLFGSMDFANNCDIRLFAPKRILIIDPKPYVENNPEKYCVLNNMGTHWDGRWENNNGKLVQYINENNNIIDV